MSTNPIPSVVRSQRNNIRRPASHHEIELDAFPNDRAGILHPYQAKADRPESVDLDSYGKLQLVRPKDHLGYFSTRLGLQEPNLELFEKLTGYFGTVAR